MKHLGLLSALATVALLATLAGCTPETAPPQPPATTTPTTSTAAPSTPTTPTTEPLVLRVGSTKPFKTTSKFADYWYGVLSNLTTHDSLIKLGADMKPAADRKSVV